MGGEGIGGGKGNRQRGKNGSSEPRKEKENERAEEGEAASERASEKVQYSPRTTKVSTGPPSLPLSDTGTSIDRPRVIPIELVSRSRGLRLRFRRKIGGIRWTEV